MELHRAQVRYRRTGKLPCPRKNIVEPTKERGHIKPMKHGIVWVALQRRQLSRYRYWQIGEVVTAVGTQGLIVETLVENPHKNFCLLPETFTLVARK